LGDKRYINSGHRRTRQAIAKGLESVPVHYTDIPPTDMQATHLVANIQRLDLSLAEVADGVWDLYNGPADGVASLVAEMLGKTKSWVSKMLLLSAPGRAHTTARRLMANDKLHDLDIAYTICRIEELEKDVAQEVAANIENETRSSVRKKLAELQKKSPQPNDDDDAGDVISEGLNDDEQQPQFNGERLSDETLLFLRRLLSDVSVAPGDLDALQKARAEVKAASAEL